MAANRESPRHLDSPDSVLGQDPAAGDRLLVAQTLTPLAFGQILREGRQLRGISQEAFADYVGVDRTYPSLLELGRKTASLLVLMDLAEGLRVTPGLLIAKTVALLNAANAARARSAAPVRLSSMKKVIYERENRHQWYLAELLELRRCLRDLPASHYARLVSEFEGVVALTSGPPPGGSVPRSEGAGSTSVSVSVGDRGWQLPTRTSRT